MKRDGFLISGHSHVVLLLCVFEDHKTAIRDVRGIHKKFPQIQIITQAYDYAIPSPDYHGFFFHKQYWTNRAKRKVAI